MTDLPTNRSLRIGKEISLKLVLIRPGSFMMGDDEGKLDREKPEHRVTITRPFYLGRFPVTQAQWRAVLGENPSRFAGENRPVGKVSWNDIVNGGKNGQPAFLLRLTEIVTENNPDFRGAFRLPTEAEWEYAAKGGHLIGEVETKAAERYPTYAGGDDLAAAGWYGYGETSPLATVAVGYRQPNALGLYGMSGNVYEWCMEAFDSNVYNKRKAGVSDPENVGKEDSWRVVRGGSWGGSAGGCRTVCRNGDRPGDRRDFLGFRLVWVPEFG